MTDLTSIIEHMNPWMIQATGALLILFIGFIAGRVLGQLVKRMLGGINLDKSIRQVVGAKFSLEKGVGNFVTLLIYSAAVIMTLDYLSLTTWVLTIILSAIIIVLFASLLLAVRDLLPNLFAGLTLKYKKDFTAGDSVTVKDVVGVVREVTLLSTRLDAQGDTIVIPNSVFQQQGYHVKNKTRKKKN